MIVELVASRCFCRARSARGEMGDTAGSIGCHAADGRGQEHNCPRRRRRTLEKGRRRRWSREAEAEAEAE